MNIFLFIDRSMERPEAVRNYEDSRAEASSSFTRSQYEPTPRNLYEPTPRNGK